MTAEILTLCEPCAAYLGESFFRVTKISHPITTDKKDKCQQCRKKLPDNLLSQYTVTARRK